MNYSEINLAIDSIKESEDITKVKQEKIKRLKELKENPLVMEYLELTEENISMPTYSDVVVKAFCKLGEVTESPLRTFVKFSEDSKDNFFGIEFSYYYNLESGECVTHDEFSSQDFEEENTIIDLTKEVKTVEKFEEVFRKIQYFYFSNLKTNKNQEKSLNSLKKYMKSLKKKSIT